MLRANRIIGPRLCQLRAYNFRNEEVKLPGMKEEVELSEEMRKIEKALLEGAKDSPELLKEIRGIYSPYKALNIPETATQQEIRDTISLRRRQYQSQIEDVQKRLQAKSTPDSDSALIATANDQVAKLEQSLAEVNEIEHLLGSIQARRKFDQEYALQVHQVIWNDLSRGEKIRHQLAKVIRSINYLFPRPA